MQTIASLAERLGAEVEPTRNGHLRVSRNGGVAVIHGIHGNLGPRHWMNTITTLVRYGVATREELEDA